MGRHLRVSSLFDMTPVLPPYSKRARAGFYYVCVDLSAASGLTSSSAVTYEADRRLSPQSHPCDTLSLSQWACPALRRDLEPRTISPPTAAPRHEHDEVPVPSSPSSQQPTSSPTSPTYSQGRRSSSWNSFSYAAVLRGQAPINERSNSTTPRTAHASSPATASVGASQTQSTTETKSDDAVDNGDVECASAPPARSATIHPAGVLSPISTISLTPQGRSLSASPPTTSVRPPMCPVRPTRAKAASYSSASAGGRGNKRAPTLTGFYYSTSASPYQQLSLTFQPTRSSPSYEFR